MNRLLISVAILLGLTVASPAPPALVAGAVTAGNESGSVAATMPLKGAEVTPMGGANLYTASTDGQNGMNGAPVVNACQGYPGPDWTSKVTAASAAYKGRMVEIDVDTSCGANASSPFVLQNGQTLKFNGAGTFTSPQGSLALGNNIITGTGPQAVWSIANNQTGALLFTADGWGTAKGTNAASNVTVENMTLDGNQANGPISCHSNQHNNFTACAHGIYINSTPSAAPSNITVQNVTFQNWEGFPIFIETGSVRYSSLNNKSISDWPEASNVAILNSTFNNTRREAIKVYGFNSHLKIAGNTFLNYANDGTGLWDAINWANADANLSSCTVSSPLITHDWDIEYNKFLNTTPNHSVLLKFATEIYGGTSPCAGVDGLNYSHNLHDGNGYRGGTGLSTNGTNGTISDNVWRNGTSGGDRNGIESTTGNSTISGNTIQGGSIWAYASLRRPISNVNITGNTVTNYQDGGAYGIVIGGHDFTNISTKVSVVGNTVDVTGSACRNNDGGILLSSTGSSVETTIRGNQIRLCNGDAAHGIRIATTPGQTTKETVIENNWIYGRGSSGYGVDNTSTDARDTDLHINGNHVIGTKMATRVLLSDHGAWSESGTTTSGTRPN